MHRRVELQVTHDWSGQALPAQHRVAVGLHLHPDRVQVEIDAPFHGDPPPLPPPGPRDHLWEHEVVEVFLADEHGHYLELECSPWGHWLALAFEQVRVPFACPLASISNLARAANRWRCTATLSTDLLSSSVMAANACSIHGMGAARLYASSTPLPGEQPDFHQPQHFTPID